MATKRVSERNLKCKVVVIGDLSVGKTLLVDTFVNREDEYEMSKSSQFSVSSKGSLPRSGYASKSTSFISRESKVIKLDIWDTAGQERYRSLTSSYYRGTHGCLILFDVRKGHTFDSVQSWYNDLEAYCTSPEMISTILVGNNCDAEDREVPKEKAVKLAEHIGIPYMEIRSDNTQTVNDVFEALADMIIDTYKVHPSLDTISTSTRLPKPSHKHRTWCSC
ncbi:ras-related protein RIC1-like isoform X2 [Mizuhopecten yessoensis]|uniref:Ras-related protein RIC1 n=1 Tax=Mizuhopecten yessoensis TaxID=6573 RepID=A0A210R6Y9_MIZYE|nr:ras-related protein RIC1-like isoform X2 [Mizuhopecten yessoensis]OWF56810.1 Ras-related protein RIC1 [Mizuhopecten yessoensis]